jgi:8-oxo-dGTP diphosphatase
MQHIYKVGAVIIDHAERKMLVVRKEAGDRPTFIIPGGRRELGEDDEATCHREIVEELGVNVTEMHFLGRFEEPAEFGEGLLEMPVYLVSIHGTPKPCNEIVELAWIDSSYASEGLTLGSTLRNHVVPLAASRGLIA